MAHLSLILATEENNLMNAVITEWDKQVRSQRLPKPIIASLRSYEALLQPDKTYGVYALCEYDRHGRPKPPFEAIVHINHAFPKTTKPQLRLIWNRLAPKYEWEENPAENHARIFSALVGNAITLSQTTFKSVEVKMYLYNNADRNYARKFASNFKEAENLTSIKLPFTVSVKGSWLHLNWNETGQ